MKTSITGDNHEGSKKDNKTTSYSQTTFICHPLQWHHCLLHLKNVVKENSDIKKLKHCLLKETSAVMSFSSHYKLTLIVKEP